MLIDETRNNFLAIFWVIIGSSHTDSVNGACTGVRGNKFVSHVNEALVSFDERHNITTLLSDPVGGITERVYQELKVLHAFDDAIPRSGLYKRVALLPDEVDEAIQRLESKGAVAVKGDQIIEKSDTL